MNPGYSQHQPPLPPPPPPPPPPPSPPPLSPCQMSLLPNEGPYRPSLGPHPPPPSIYPSQHRLQHLPSSHPSTVSPRQFPDPTTNPYAAQRMPLPESMAHGGERSLVPGQPPQPREPLSTSREENGRRYELRVVQQPQRARMCGFGDKDRRPITPPPCVLLIITDINTGKPIDPNDVESSLMILMVDLWDAAGANEANLVRNVSVQTPDISTITPVPHQQNQYVTGASEPMPNGHPHGNASHQGQGFHNPFPGQSQVNPYPGSQAQQYGRALPQYGQPQYSQYPPQHQQSHPGYANGGGGYLSQNGYGQPPPPQSPFYSTGVQSHGIAATANGDCGPPSQQFQARQYQPEPLTPRNTANSPNPKGMYTRNLIGSLAGSASKLIDTNGDVGIWFVLQDLSVRTEGDFRLRFSYCNVALPTMSGIAQPPKQSNIASGSDMVPLAPLNTGKAAVLATVFSVPFTVYSAKRFPGVVESTKLSRAFALQGIKIPIRKDTNGRGERHQEEEEDD